LAYGVGGEVNVGGGWVVAFSVVFKGNGAGFVTYAEGDETLIPLLVADDSLAGEGVAP
jgi:hypothetical protein